MDSHNLHSGRDNERALFMTDQERLESPSSTHQPYHDSPSREFMSPPPGYTSPEPLESPLPASPTRALYREPSESARHSRSSRETSRDHYTDDVPPPPPPHRSSISRSIHRKSVTQEPSTPVLAGRGSYEEQRTTIRSDHVIQDSPQQQNGLDAIRAMQPPMLPQGHRQDQSYGPNLFPRPPSRLPDRTSYSSNIPFAAAAATPGSITPASTPDVRSSRYSGRSIPLEDYSIHSHPQMAEYHNDSPYRESGYKINATVSDASINPYDIADDGDDGFIPDPKRKSILPQHQKSAAPIATTAAGSGVAGIFGRKDKARTASGSYNPVQGAPEKGSWRAEQTRGRKNRKWLGIGIGAIIVVAIIAGIVGGVLGTRGSAANTGSDINNANDDTAHNGDLDINSAEIKTLMNNPNLHKVFPGIDYTPWGVQYPLCLTYPPSQNNVTRDMAVLSQLTNTVRLYGTDCNQTEMVLHAIDRLKLTDMKIWLGVWVDTNTTTTNRQVAQMYKILEETSDRSIFKGAIVGNEALYRAGEDKDQSKQELITLLTNTKANFTSLGYNLPVATSDLGDNWSGDLVAVSDYVMSNIHPFFAGVSADLAAAWTWNFWQQKDVVLTTNTNVKQIISETGWPSSGGTDCGGTTGACNTGQSGAVASIDGMNTFMSDWVCQALANGTEYFWFEAFDEPWKIQYDTPGMAWEDKWGLMDAARNLKQGIKIPDCGGKTVSS